MTSEASHQDVAGSAPEPVTLVTEPLAGGYVREAYADVAVVVRLALPLVPLP